jgi:predicted molibdopterin-dependent oxidoreductase YjgC
MRGGEMAKVYDRLTTPLVREAGRLREASWDEAIDRVSGELLRHHGTAVGMFSCSKATNEMNYMAQKFSRLVLGSNNIDSCNRT